jgi:hypothetical protein
MDIPKLENNSPNLEALKLLNGYGDDKQTFFTNLNKLTEHIDNNEEIPKEGVEYDVVEMYELNKEDIDLFSSQFSFNVNEENEELLNDEQFNFKPFTAEYYKKLYPLFDDEICEIMAIHTNITLDENSKKMLKITENEKK